jgi:hypothetical protein
MNLFALYIFAVSIMASFIIYICWPDKTDNDTNPFS